jgi:hypothetical protein
MRLFFFGLVLQLGYTLALGGVALLYVFQQYPRPVHIYLHTNDSIGILAWVPPRQLILFLHRSISVIDAGGWDSNPRLHRPLFRWRVPLTPPPASLPSC